MLDFRPLRRADFGLLARWLDEPLVRRWWNHETSPEAIERDFGPAVDGRDPTEVCVACEDDRPVGLIQRYLIAATPAYEEELRPVLALPPGALGLDYLIGEPDRRGRGVGPAMIAAFAAGSWARYPQAAGVVVPVSAANRASWRALERAGFERVAEGELEPDNPVDSRDHYVYRLARPSSAGAAASSTATSSSDSGSARPAT